MPQPTYLALDSEAAWATWFGAEPPPADPPVDWEREFVLFASLGPQAADMPVDVGSIVQREDVVSVWLTGRRCTAFLPRQGRCDSVSFRPAHELPTRLSCEQAWRALLSIQSRHGLSPLLNVPLGLGIGIYSIWVLVQDETEKLFGPCC